MSNRAVEYLENSFLKDLISDDQITDISFNGENVYYVHNKKGRIKSDLIVENALICDFVRQIANLTEKQFSYVDPILDVSFGRYRFNAVHQSIARVNNEKAINFSIRIVSYTNRIENDQNFMNDKMKKYLLSLINTNQSIIIAGETGYGKTELQKYLLSKLKSNTRVIVIDNLQELEILRGNSEIDLNSWQVSKLNKKSFEDLISNALRCNPDYLIVSEARGGEMSYLLTSVMSGHPLISTIHAYSVEEIPHRICRLIQLKDTNQKYEDIFNDVVSHIFNYVYVRKTINEDGSIKRYISDIGIFDKAKMSYKTIFHKER